MSAKKPLFTSDEHHTAEQMLKLRKAMRLSRASFGLIIGMDSINVATREQMRVRWSAANLDAARDAINRHLEEVEQAFQDALDFPF